MLHKRRMYLMYYRAFLEIFIKRPMVIHWSSTYFLWNHINHESFTDLSYSLAPVCAGGQTEPLNTLKPPATRRLPDIQCILEITSQSVVWQLLSSFLSQLQTLPLIRYITKKGRNLLVAATADNRVSLEDSPRMK